MPGPARHSANYAEPFACAIQNCYCARRISDLALRVFAPDAPRPHSTWRSCSVITRHHAALRREGTGGGCPTLDHQDRAVRVENEPTENMLVSITSEGKPFDFQPGCRLTHLSPISMQGLFWTLRLQKSKLHIYGLQDSHSGRDRTIVTGICMVVR